VSKDRTNEKNEWEQNKPKRRPYRAGETRAGQMKRKNKILLTISRVISGLDFVASSFAYLRTNLNLLFPEKKSYCKGGFKEAKREESLTVGICRVI
jgi:hypothetical protein